MTPWGTFSGSLYVSPNAAHYCYGYGNRVDDERGFHVAADARVAAALERIAAALEALCARAPGEAAK